MLLGTVEKVVGTGGLKLRNGGRSLSYDGSTGPQLLFLANIPMSHDFRGTDCWVHLGKKRLRHQNRLTSGAQLPISGHSLVIGRGGHILVVYTLLTLMLSLLLRLDIGL